jgi:CheY-like chemotaxis protein/cytochrome c-type biogenesis protein CcmH/NrfG
MALTVLLVDDDPMARGVIERTIVDDTRLRPFEPRVVQAASGEQGLAVFVNERPAVVVTDLIMTGMDGFGLCRAIREAPFGQEVGLIVISGVYKDASLADNLEKTVRASFLAKPFSRAELIEAILARAGLATPAPTTQVPTVPANVPPASSPPGQGTETIRLFPPSPAGQVGNSGSLGEVGIVKLIFEFADRGQTGTLALSHGKVRKEIYFRDGRVVAADSNLRQEALGTLLCAKGIIDERQLAYLLAETKARGHKMGAVLIELGWLSPEEVLQFLAAQVHKRISDCLRWDEGTWTFTPGDTFGERVIEHDLDIDNTIFSGLMHTADPEKLISRIEENGARTIRLSSRFERHRPGFEAVFGAQIAQDVAAGASLGSFALRDDAQLVIAAIDALLTSGLADLGDPEGEVEPTDQPAAWQTSLSLEQLGNEVSRSPEHAPHNNAEELFSQVTQSPAPTPEDSGCVSQPMEALDSGVMDMGVGAFTRAPEESAGARSHSETAREALMRACLNIRGKPLHEVLGVARDAPMGDTLAAISAMAAEFSPERMAGDQLSATEQANLDSLRTTLEQAARDLATPRQQQRKDSPVQTAAPTTDPLSAELAFGEAMQLFNLDRVAEALPKFEAAVRAQPDQALYQAYLGWAKLVAFGPELAGQTREALDLALSLDPDLAEAHAMLGRLAASEDDALTARDCLLRSLELQPEQPEMIELLIEAYRRLDDPKGAETFLRKLVAALGDRARPLQQRLWRELAAIYETQLGDRGSARIAYDTAARLAPTDIEVLRKSAEINAEDPSRWREMARAVMAEWQLNPQNVSAGEQLLNLFLQQRRTHAAAITAAAMVLHDVATVDTLKLANEGRKTRLPRWPKRLPAEWPVRLGCPPDFVGVGNLLALLDQFGILPPVTPRELSVGEGSALIATDGQPEIFRSTLRSLCGLLGVPEPRVFQIPTLVGGARMAHTRPPSLLCDGALLEQSDPVELGFRLSRALALASPGMLAGSARSGGQLRPFFMAALATARGNPNNEDPIFLAAKARIAKLDAPVRARIAESSQTLMYEFGSINLSAWTKTLGRVAIRLSLLVCGDLLRVGTAVAEEEGKAALDDLLSFALSFDYLDFSDEIHASAS